MNALRYDAARAARDLADADLLAGVLVEQDGVLVSGDPTVAVGGFAGAGLDSRNLFPEQLFVALTGTRADGCAFAPAVLAAGHWVLTRAADDPVQHPLMGSSAVPGTGTLLSRDPVAALGCLARCWRARHDVTVVAITGTNGKTTTKDFLASMLGGAGEVLATRGNLNNLLGVPLTLLGLTDTHRHAVVELGASAVGEIAALARLARPTVGVITNAAPAHLAEFGSLEGVIAGKGELVAALPAGGTAVLNADSPGFDTWCANTGARVLSWGRGTGDHLWSWQATADGGELVLDRRSWPVPLPGDHNGANLVAAVLAGRALGLGDADLRRGLANFSASPHRGAVLALGGRTILDDAYNANPRSMVAAAHALQGLPGSGRTVAVLGHMGELGPDSEDIHRQTGRELTAAGLDHLVTVGDGARPLGEGFSAAGGRSGHCDDQAAAATWLTDHTTAGDRVLVKGSRSAAMEIVIEIFAASSGGS